MELHRHLLVLPFMLPLLAQAPERHTYVGIVRDHDGRLLAGVTVTVVGGEPGGSGRTADVVQATTGDAGRFRAALRPGREHFAWAARVTGAGTNVGGTAFVCPNSPAKESKHGLAARSAMTPEPGPATGLISCTYWAPCPACLSHWLDR
jgi:hypothetical protein